MAIPWSSPTYSRYRANRGEPPQTSNGGRQVQIEKLDRASRLLLGALIEAHDVLQQLQAESESGDQGAVNASVEANIERVRQFAQVIREPKNELTNTTSDNQVASTPKKQKDIVPANNDIDTKASDKNNGCEVAPTFTPVPTFVRNTLPDLVQNVQVSDSYVPNKFDLNAPLPDLLMGSNLSPKAITPRKKFSPKKYAPRKKKVFKLTTLEEMQMTKTSQDNLNPISWKDAGSKLSDVAKSWDFARRPSLPNVRNNVDVHPRDHHLARRHSLARWMRGELSHDDRLSSVDENESSKKTDILLSSVFRVVQAVGLFLIIRKVENMFQ
eukprot:TRINITY_DN16492_c0_g1_i1.p1 TRINITY_DN16492_c0_g1~~TRINITY_DN16492_c0_g1_i1.p1  ORF type:complete len:326 (+),score=60.07 TRINITY_DN16492_c0_g1_i1:183-1160(+)